MRLARTILGTALVGALAATGTLIAPAQAAPITRPVTSGFAQFVIDAPAGVPSGWVLAESPGRTTPQGLIFPIRSVSLDGATVALKGDMVLSKSSIDPAPFGVTLTLDRETRDIQVTLTAQGQSTPVFFSTRMKVTTAVKVDKAKKTRTTTTTWTGDLRLYDGSASGYSFAENLNQVYRVTSFSPGMNLGQVALKVSTTVPCKNAACTK